MNQKIDIFIEGIDSQKDKMEIETGLEVLDGVKNVNIDQGAGKAIAEFDDSKTTQGKILETIEKLGYKIRKKTESAIKEQVYYARGMHCASCEILIEKKLLRLKGVESVEASTNKGKVVIEYKDEKPSIEELNRIFKEDNYIFSDEPETKKNNGIFMIISTALLIIAGFLYLNRLGLASLVNVSSKSSLPTFFTLGLIAGISSCAALVGGLVLSMSKQWQDIYSNQKKSIFGKLQPHLMFNAGRLVSYAFLGTVLGLIGSRLQVSLGFTSLLIIGISVLMVFLALQMLGIKKFQKFQFSLPKSATRYIADESNFKGKYMPFAMGALTFFLPCGFTITSQGMALLSGNPIQGGLIMFFFALGTAPALLAIGFSSIKFYSRPNLAYRFSKIAGILVLFFALFNINSQLNVLGYNSFNDLIKTGNSSSQAINQNYLPAIVNGKQIIKMNASASGYKPNYFKVKAGVPVRWEITDTGTSGCTNAIISKSLFDGEIDLTPGQTSIKEFTPTKPGKYKFSCWMGMVSGIIEVVSDSGTIGDATTASASDGLNIADDNNVIPSGAKGCGCGGSGSSCGGTGQ
jgi:sulfite exporter TauE/SafE/copper chaperone CopZ/plastocyanin